MVDQHITTITKSFKDNDLIIIPSDKGGNWVIMDKSTYNSSVDDHLASKYYKISNKKSISNQVNLYFNHLKNYKYISKQEHKYLLVDKNKQRQIYALPKIHKSIWPNNIPPTRPIISNINSDTHSACKFIDYFLKPLCQKYSSYIKDTSHLISTISNVTIKNSSIFTLDLVSLYTNIPVTQAIKEIQNIFTKFPDTKRPDILIIKLLKLILDNNIFTFSNKFYKQSEGLSMGAHFSPSLAIIYMNAFENKYLSQYNIKPLLWLRYIDDVFGVWHNNANFNDFFQYINSRESFIKFTGSPPSNTVNFLDVTIFIEDDHLAYKPYFKPTHNFNLLSPSSNHPLHIFKSIIKNEIRRLIFNSYTKDIFMSTMSSIKPF